MIARDFRMVSEADGVDLQVHTWRPKGPVRGLVQIHHGMAEHGARYAQLAEALVERGLVAWAPDHRGHGKSVPAGAEPGHFGDTGGWDHAVADLVQLNRRFQDEHPGLPVFVIGHSMGSFLTMQFLMEHGQHLAGAVLTGSNGAPGPLRHVGAVVARMEERRLGPLGKSALIDRMSFGAFNQGIENPRTDFDWLSRDPVQVDAYVADARCGFPLTTRAWRQFLHALRLIHRDDHIARLPRGVPMLVLSGDADPVGEHGRGVERLVRAWEERGLWNVELRLVPGARHEVFNETDREETIGFVADWLAGKIEN